MKKVFIFIITALFVSCLFFGCTSTTLPNAEDAGSISGEINLDGDSVKGVLAVKAYSTYPPMGVPYAAMVIENPEFPQEYKLANLEPYTYYIKAEFVTDDAIYIGGYPNYCDIDKGVEVKKGKVQKNIDLTLYTSGEAVTKCFGGDVDDDDVTDDDDDVTDDDDDVTDDDDDVTDDDDNNDNDTWGGIELTVKYDGAINPEDDVYGAIFAECPPEASSPPIWVGKTKEPQFPVTWSGDAVEPGDYCLKICLDVGEYDNTCDGYGDILMLFDDGNASVEIKAGETTKIIADLDMREFE